MKNAVLIWLFLVLLINLAYSQGLPTTSITLFEFDFSKDSVFHNAKNLTGFNPNGYNNQPSFFDDNILYITSDWEANGETDIIKLNLKSENLLKVTDTDESEYSPTLTPDQNNFSIICVPPSSEENAPQFLWKYPLDRKDSGIAITFDITNVGYHCWLNSIDIAMFLVGDPHKLIIYNTLSGTSEDIDSNIGRCLRVNNKNELIYVHKAALNIWYLKSYNPITKKKHIIGETKTGSEDFDILQDNSIIMGRGSSIFQLSNMGGWRLVDDLHRFGINNISRIAIRNNKIALVHASL